MRQVVQDFKTGKIKLIDVPAPALAPGMVLVRTAASAISVGTERSTADVGRKSLLGKARARPDLVKKILDNVKREGLATTIKKVQSKLDDWKPMGYSSAGVILALGEDVDDLLPGMRVACGGADYAVHGEISCVPKNLCVPLEDQVNFEDAAFTTISAIALQGIRQADIRLGGNVVVFGLGLLGLLTIQLLKAAGANVLGIDIRSSALSWAQRIGCDRTVLAGEEDAQEVVASWSDGIGADAVILTTATKSNEPMQMAPHLLRDRGRIVVVGVAGLELAREPFYHGEHEVFFSRSYGPGRYDPIYEEKGVDYPIGYVRWTERRNMQAVVRLMAQGKFQPSRLITHRFDIGEAEKAYDTILSGQAAPVGVLLTYPDSVHTPPRIEIAPRPAVKKLGIGIIGAGSFARSYILPEILKCRDTEIRAVATAHGHTARMIAEKYRIPSIATDAREILEDDSVHLVFVLTRHDLHGSLVLEALRRGKMVYVEKPLVLNGEELDAIEKFIRSRPDAWMMVGFNRVFSPHFDYLRQAFQSQTTFLNYRVNAGRLPAGHWVKDARIGGGRWIGEGCHFLHLALHWMKAEPSGFKAYGIPVEGDDADENLSLLLDFSHRGTYSLTYTSRGAATYPKEHLEIWGGGRTGIMEDYRISTLFPGGKQQKTHAQDKGHSREIKATLDCALGGTPPPLSTEELLATHRWLLRIQAGMRSRE
jgi:polar amino acid transport system substrate-binding protein